jgi:hypothetical protein
MGREIEEVGERVKTVQSAVIRHKPSATEETFKPTGLTGRSFTSCAAAAASCNFRAACPSDG